MAFYDHQQHQQQGAANLNFYQPQYAAQPQTMGLQGSMDGAFQPTGYVAGQMGDDTLSRGVLAAFSTSGYAGEPPLLEELGINFGHIREKTLAVLNPRGPVTANIMSDSDLAGPILFCLVFGTCLLLAGKVHFGYIYGVALLGTVSLHFLFKWMSDVGIDFIRTASVLGYCLLPLVPVSFVGIFADLNNTVGYVLSALAIFWSTYSASGFFVGVLMLDNVRLLIAYPVAMFYSVFVLMAIFVEKTA